jgi:DNA polymerase III alpha subunit
LVSLYDGEEYQRTSRSGASDYKLRCGSILSVSETTTRNGDPMWWVRYLTRDGISKEPVFEWRYDSIKDSLETDVAALIVSKADTDGEYAGMYSIEDVVSMREIADGTGEQHVNDACLPTPC